MGLPRYWVNTSTLNLVIEDTDFSYQGLGPEIALTRTYNLNPGQSGMFGNGWKFRYDSEIAVTCNGAWLKKGSGQQLFYTGEICPVTPSYPITTTPPAGDTNSLSLAAADTWLFEDRATRLVSRYDFIKELETGTDPLSFKTLQLTSITDGNGNQVSVTLHPDGSINFLEDAVGRRTTFTYDANHRCIKMTTPNEKEATYTYDALGNLTSSRDLLGNLTTYTYDGDNFLTSMTVGDKTTRFTFSGSGREKKLATVTDAMGHVTTYGAEPNGMDNVVSVTDPEGKVTRFTSHDGKSTKTVTPLQYESLNDYAPTGSNTYTTGMKTGFTDARGVPTSLTYDAQNNLTASSIPQGIKRSFSYDSKNLPVSKTILHGMTSQTWQYSYDAKENLTTVTSPGLQQTVRALGGQGKVESIQNAKGNTISFAHDAFGNPTQVTDPQGNATQIAYDDWGLNPISFTDALGNTTLFEYDDNRRPTRIIHPDNSDITFTYDCCALVAMTDENGHTTAVSNNKLLAPTRITNPIGNATNLSYDSAGKVSAIENALARRTTITDDAGERPATLTNALNKTIHREYDAEWNMTSVTDERGNTTHLEYDSNHLPIAETDPLGNTTRRLRDEAGRLIGLLNAKYTHIAYAYDANGRKTGKSINGTPVSTYSYDDNGNLTQFTDSGGTSSYTYNTLDLVTKITWPDNKTADITRDQLGRTSSITYPGGITVTYTYDNRGRISTMVLSAGTLTFTYDPTSKLTGENRPNGTNTTISYNPVNLPTEINHRKGQGSFAHFTYAYDATSNLITETNSLLDAVFQQRQPAHGMGGPEWQPRRRRQPGRAFGNNWHDWNL